MHLWIFFVLLWAAVPVHPLPIDPSSARLANSSLVEDVEPRAPATQGVTAPISGKPIYAKALAPPEIHQPLLHMVRLGANAQRDMVQGQTSIENPQLEPGPITPRARKLLKNAAEDGTQAYTMLKLGGFGLQAMQAQLEGFNTPITQRPPSRTGRR